MRFNIFHFVKYAFKFKVGIFPYWKPKIFEYHWVHCTQLVFSSYKRHTQWYPKISVLKIWKKNLLRVQIACVCMYQVLCNYILAEKKLAMPAEQLQWLQCSYYFTIKFIAPSNLLQTYIKSKEKSNSCICKYWIIFFRFLYNNIRFNRFEAFWNKCQCVSNPYFSSSSYTQIFGRTGWQNVKSTR